MAARSSCKQFQYVVDKVWSRIQGWSEKFLSYAGREIMIKVVLQSLPTYTMSCFLPLKNLCDEIVSLIS